MDRPIVRSWGKALLGLGSLGLALAAGINATANRWRIADPDLTLRLRPDDALSLTLREDQRHADVEMNAARADAVAAIARRALRSDPLTAAALRQIAVAESMAGRPQAADRLLGLSHDVTRRELGTSWLLIEAALDRGDAVAVMRHFDEALTTSLVAGELMYPALSAALFDPGLRAALVPYVRESRDWVPGLMRHALADGEAGKYVGALVIAAGGLPRSPIYVGLDSRILSAVAAEGDFQLAGAYLRQLGAAGIATDPGFTETTTDPRFGSFAWSFVDRQDLSGQRDDSGRLHVRVSTPRPGRVAVRTLLLPAGRYRFSQQVETPQEDVMAAAKWEMICLPSTMVRPVWSLELPVRRTSSHYAGQFEVPADCAGQQLSLVVAGSGDQEDAEIIVDSLELARQ
ncbi:MULTISPECIES: hypothetical protein [unclassified Sphingomonas]|uniref:hypothetical protein n=1 Tax=unclassified Sphingomonas TaxID=196159 RepID=UPI0006FD6E5E|nr:MULTISPECIES: hypothetical protein [unclassified Sphingomonas]KQX19531.1 hypothetical protein ASD17_13535 [Sphingomonas sp. Root1294]KQY65732.1 hypothetical protein ASD39_16735 [Sphingomonas sp. Root50]KRB94963.1 hypothetical protein ASE22_03320 [Sphingomonas sp. Root720]